MDAPAGDAEMNQGQLPLFPDADPDPDYQDEYRELLQRDWDISLRIVIAQYGIPPWCEQDNLLNADELRLMTLIDESGEGWIEGEKVTIKVPYSEGTKEERQSLFPGQDVVRRVSTITVNTGFNAEANCQAVINGCLEKGYIRRITTNTESRLMIDEEGRWRLDAMEGMKDEY